MTPARWLLAGACLLFTSAYNPAHAFYCNRPSEPSLPDGNASNMGEMKDAESEVDDYLRKMGDYADCLQIEINDAIDEANRLKDDWNGVVRDFNSQ